MTRQIKCASCAVLWTTALCLGIAGTAESNLRLLFWSGLVALVAAVFSGLVIAEYAAGRAVREERVRVETLVQAMIGRARDRAAGNVDRIH